MSTSIIARQMLTLANIPSDVKGFVQEGIAAHQVGNNSPLGQAYAQLRRAPAEMVKQTLAEACYNAIVLEQPLDLEATYQMIYDIEYVAEKLTMTLAAGRGFTPRPIALLSIPIENGIEGAPRQWKSLSADEVIDYLKSDDFDPNRYAAGYAFEQIDWDNVGFDDLQHGEPIYTYYDGELTEDTPYTQQVVERVLDTMHKFNDHRLEALLAGPERWKMMYPVSWLAINEKFLKEAISMYVFWQPKLQERVERAQDVSYLTRTADGRGELHDEGEDQRMQEGKGLHLLTDKAIAQHNLAQMEALVATVTEIVTRNVGDIPKALGRPLAAKAVLDPVSGKFLYMDIDTRLAEAIREEAEAEAMGRVYLTEEKRTRRVNAVNEINLDDLGL